MKVQALVVCCLAFALLGGCAHDRSGGPVPDAAAPANAESMAPGATPYTLSAAPAAAAAPSAAAPGSLVIAPLKLANARGEGLALSADGTLSVVGETRQIGRLLADGSFVTPEGSVRARLSPGGTVYGPDGHELPLSIDEAGVIHPQGWTEMHFAADGSLVGGNPSAPATRIEGIKPETRRTAAFLLILAAFPTH
jgi:hypothetical protein